MDRTSLALALTTAVLVPFVSSGLRVSPGLALVYGGMDRSRNVVIRTGERGSGVV